MEIHFTVDGKPKGKDRPRFRKIGNYVSTYTTESTKEYEKKVAQSYNKYYKDSCQLEGPLAVDMKCYFAPPTSMSKKKQQELLNKPYTKKPDADNLAKSVLDSLNEIVYKDDSQATDIDIKKRYAFEERVEVCIRELDYIIRPAIYYLEGENYEKLHNFK